MPKHIDESELEKIFQLIPAGEAGLSIEEIHMSLGKDIPKSNIMRRLKVLINQRKVEVFGAAKATRYRAAKLKEIKSENITTISVSIEGSEVAKLVQRPIQQRIPVGYNRSLLENYEPNKTRYLKESQAAELLRLGQVNLAPDIFPAGTYARQILDRLLIDLSWNSSRLEGNTYSLLDTKRLISEGVGRDDKTALESQMILNHKAAIEFLVEDAENIGFNGYTLKNLHALISDNLLENPNDCGLLRMIEVGIEGSVYVPLGIPQQIEEYFDLFLKKASSIQDPFEQSLFTMAFIPYLQPFVDGNKRTSRLAANIPFIKRNLCPLSFTDVPEKDYTDSIIGFYELGRVELLRDIFFWAYERSSLRYRAIRQSLGEPDQFKLRYRQQIAEIVGTIIRERNPFRSKEQIKELAKNVNIEETDIERFVDVIVREVKGLHVGNIARFRIRPSEFQAWQISGLSNMM